MPVSISRKENKLVVKFDYAGDRIAKIKSFTDYYWDAANKVWILPYSDDNVKNLKKLFSNETCTVCFGDNTAINSIYKSMADKLKLKGYRFKTIKTYVNHVKIFYGFINKDIMTINSSDVQEYILYLLREHEVSHSYASQSISTKSF